MVERGDELYCRDPKGVPFTGKVLAAGENGCTLRVGGKRQQVPWESVHGHKVRVQPALSIVDEGEDGFIAKEPKSGVLRYVHDPLGTGEEDMDAGSPMTKALDLIVRDHMSPKVTAIDRLVDMRLEAASDLLAKALKTAPGDKKPVPAAKAGQVGHLDAKDGDTVKFKLGELSGSGKIVATGARGAQVVDGSGHVHKVTWEQMEERTPAKTPAGGPKLVIPAKPRPAPAAETIPVKKAAKAKPKKKAKPKASAS